MLSASSCRDLFIFPLAFPFRHGLPLLFMSFLCDVNRLVDTYIFFSTRSCSQFSSIYCYLIDRVEIFRSRGSKIGTCRILHLFFCELAMFDLSRAFFFFLKLFLFLISLLFSPYTFFA